MDGNEGENLRVELGVRSLAPAGRKRQQDAVIRCLEDLERDGVVEEFSVSVRGRRLGLDGAGARTGAGEELLATVERFEQWADRNDLSIGAFFETKRIRSELSGEDYRALELPAMTLAEHVDDRLRWVSPCLDPATDTVYTVEDRIETLSTTAEDLAVEASSPTATPVPEE